MLGYCVKCRKKVEMSGPKKIKIKSSRGSRPANRGSCPDCGTTVVVFTKA